MRENRLSGSEGGGAKPIVSPYPYYISRPWRLVDRVNFRSALLGSVEWDAAGYANGRFRLILLLKKYPPAKS